MKIINRKENMTENMTLDDKREIIDFIMRHGKGLGADRNEIFVAETEKDFGIVCAMYLGQWQYPFIQVNFEKWNESGYLAKKSYLLHEIGHLMMYPTGSGSGSDSEYKAHKWAIEYAEKKQLTGILKELIECLKTWGLAPYDDEYTIYREAYDIFLKDRGFVKRYKMT